MASMLRRRIRIPILRCPRPAISLSKYPAGQSLAGLRTPPSKARHIRQTVHILKRHHPARILRWQRAHFIQALDLVRRKLNIAGSQVLLKLIDPLRPNDHRRHKRLRQRPPGSSWSRRQDDGNHHQRHSSKEPPLDEGFSPQPGEVLYPSA